MTLKWVFVANLGGGEMVPLSSQVRLKYSKAESLQLPPMVVFGLFFFLRQLLHWAPCDFSCVKVASS